MATQPPELHQRADEPQADFAPVSPIHPQPELESCPEIVVLELEYGERDVRVSGRAAPGLAGELTAVSAEWARTLASTNGSNGTEATTRSRSGA